jgi:hypothetical protein
MILLYSGAHKTSCPQLDPNLSLGGHVSNSPIPNGKINNIFPPISRQSLRDNSSATRLIVLKNDSQQLTNLTIWTISGNLSTYKIATVAPSINANGDPIFEQIYDSNSIPYQAVLAAQEGQSNSIIISVINPNQFIGVWIKKDFNLNNFSQLDGAELDVNIPCSDLETLLEADQTSNLDQGQLFIQWD